MVLGESFLNFCPFFLIDTFEFLNIFSSLFTFISSFLSKNEPLETETSIDTTKSLFIPLLGKLLYHFLIISLNKMTKKIVN